MKRTLTALTTAAILATGGVTTASAMEAEANALTGAVYQTLNNMQMDLAGIEDLSIRDIRAIQGIMHGGDTESEKRQKINNILRKASGN